MTYLLDSSAAFYTGKASPRLCLSKASRFYFENKQHLFISPSYNIRVKDTHLFRTYINSSSLALIYPYPTRPLRFRVALQQPWGVSLEGLYPNTLFKSFYRHLEQLFRREETKKKKHRSFDGVPLSRRCSENTLPCRSPLAAQPSSQ